MTVALASIFKRGNSLHCRCNRILHLSGRWTVPTRSRGGDVAVYVFDIHQPSLPFVSFCFVCLFVLVSVSVLMALSTVFHSINSPDNSPFSHSVLPVFLSALLGLLFISS